MRQEMNSDANWELVLVVCVFTSVLCALAWYVHTNQAENLRREDQAIGTFYTLVCGQENDGRYWSAVPSMPGILAFGENEDEVKARVSALALHLIADRLEAGETNACTFTFHVPPPLAERTSETTEAAGYQAFLYEVEQLAADTFETMEDAHDWLRRPHPSFGGVTPLRVSQTQEGAKQVREMLVCIKYGGVA